MPKKYEKNLTYVFPTLAAFLWWKFTHCSKRIDRLQNRSLKLGLSLFFYLTIFLLWNMFQYFICHLKL